MTSQLNEQRRVNADLQARLAKSVDEATALRVERDNVRQMLEGAERRLDEVERFAQISQGQATHLNQKILELQSAFDEACKQNIDMKGRLDETARNFSESGRALGDATQEVNALRIMVHTLQRQNDEHAQTSATLYTREQYEDLKTRLETEYTTRLQQFAEEKRRDLARQESERVRLQQELTKTQREAAELAISAMQLAVKLPSSAQSVRIRSRLPENVTSSTGETLNSRRTSRGWRSRYVSSQPNVRIWKPRRVRTLIGSGRRSLH